MRWSRLNSATLAAGQSGTVTATVRNLSSTQTLGSANIKPPSGFVVTAATVPDGTPTSQRGHREAPQHRRA